MEASVRFKRAVRFDELVTIDTTVIAVTRVTVRFRYQLRAGAELACEAETLLACVGNDLKLKRMPPDVAKVFASPESMA